MYLLQFKVHVYFSTSYNCCWQWNSSHWHLANSFISHQLGSPLFIQLCCYQHSELSRTYLQTNCLLHSKPLLRQLLRLPVESRIHCKLAAVKKYTLFANSLQYLASLIHYNQPILSLHSEDQHFLLPTSSITNFTACSFRCFASTISNPIPLEIC